MPAAFPTLGLGSPLRRAYGALATAALFAMMGTELGESLPISSFLAFSAAFGQVQTAALSFTAMISSLLAKPHTKVVVENPGFPDARNIFSLHTSDIHLQEVDSQGIVLDTIPDGTEMVFATPSHQSPTTVTMPLTRRLELIEKAREKDFHGQITAQG